MKLLTLLRHAPGRLAKLVLLKTATEIELEVFKAAYTQEASYGVRLYHADLQNLGEPNPELFELLGLLARRELSGDLARKRVLEHTLVHGDLIVLICNRDLDCGVTATTVNKVHPGTIPQFKLQLAREVPLSECAYPMYAELKYDGVRVAITWDGSTLLFRTRNGKVLHLPYITSRFLAVLLDEHSNYVAPFMLDTEATLQGGMTKDRTKISGMLNSARCGKSIDETNICFNVFDSMPYLDFVNRTSTTKFENGRRELTPQFLLQYLKPLMTQGLLERTKSTLVQNAEEANDLFELYLGLGQEGLILKKPNHIYGFKRSKDWIKVKAIKSCDIECVGTEEGKGKYVGQIGKLTCVGIIEGKHITVKVGSGLTDLDRASTPQDFIGQLIEIKYNEVQIDSKGHPYLFLPRFVTVRTDK